MDRVWRRGLKIQLGGVYAIKLYLFIMDQSPVMASIPSLIIFSLDSLMFF